MTTKILLVEDQQDNIRAAKEFLKEFDLTIVKNYNDAIRVISEKSFDVLMTDVNIPKGKDSVCTNDSKTYPLGLIIALRAMSHGIKKVGILTSGDHHTDAITYAFDGGIKIGTDIYCTNNCNIYVIKDSFEKVDMNKWASYGNTKKLLVKNWGRLLEKLLNGENGN